MALTNGSNLTIGTGSFLIVSSSQFVSGSITTIGNINLTGSFNVSGSTTQIGNNTLIGNTILSGSLEISGSQTRYGVTKNVGAWNLTGSMGISGSTTITGNTTIGGNLDLSGSINLNGSFTGSVQIDGDLNLQSPHSFYRWGNKLFNYGQWASLETQTGSANTAYPMKLEVPVPEFEGIYVGNNDSGFPTRIYAQNTGLYNIQFSAQLHTTSNQSVDFSVWFAMTGSNIANSNTDFSIEKVSGGGFQVAALNFLTPITSGSYVELYWSKTTANGQLQYKGTQSTPTRPATPSVIVTVTQVA
jgi:hypothetical protein